MLGSPEADDTTYFLATTHSAAQLYYTGEESFVEQEIWDWMNILCTSSLTGHLFKDERRRTQQRSTEFQRRANMQNWLYPQVDQEDTERRN